MSLFRIDTENPLEGPHQNQPVAEHGAQLSRARAAMIMIHGRGATAHSMFPLAEEFAQPDFYYVAPQASNHTWYPYSFLAPREKNQPGIRSGLQVIHDLIQKVEDSGIAARKIVLLGFSQGGCLATEYAARHPSRLGGVVAFSGGLIGDEVDPASYEGSLEETPVFLGCSDVDPHIPKERVDLTEEVFDRLNGDVTKRIYKGMAHTVNDDEIQFVRGMMARLLDED